MGTKPLSKYSICNNFSCGQSEKYNMVNFQGCFSDGTESKEQYFK